MIVTHMCAIIIIKGVHWHRKGVLWIVGKVCTKSSERLHYLAGILILESENTIFMTLAYLYAQRNGLNNLLNELFAYAQKVNKKDADFDRILEKYKNLNISNERMKFIKKYLLKKVEILKDIVKGAFLYMNK